MGLFSDLFGSSSHSQSTSSNSAVTNTQLAGGDIGAPVIYGDNNRQTTVITDQGTVRAATDISQAALELGKTEALTGSAVAIAGLAHAGSAYTSSLNFAGGVTHDALTDNWNVTHDAISGNTNLATRAITAASSNLNTSVQAVTAYAGKALDSVTRFGQGSLDSNTYIAGRALDSTNEAYNKSLNAVQAGFSSSLGQVNALAQQVSQSATQSTDTTVKSIVLYLVLGVAIVFIAKAKG